MTAKSSDQTPDTRRKGTTPPVPRITCMVCGLSASVLADWTPAIGLDQNTWKFRCILRHDSYRVIHSRQSRRYPPALRAAPDSQC